MVYSVSDSTPLLPLQGGITSLASPRSMSSTCGLGPSRGVLAALLGPSGPPRQGRRAPEEGPQEGARRAPRRPRQGLMAHVLVGRPSSKPKKKHMKYTRRWRGPPGPLLGSYWSPLGTLLETPSHSRRVWLFCSSLSSCLTILPIRLFLLLPLPIILHLLLLRLFFLRIVLCVILLPTPSFIQTASSSSLLRAARLCPDQLNSPGRRPCWMGWRRNAKRPELKKKAERPTCGRRQSHTSWRRAGSTPPSQKQQCET